MQHTFPFGCDHFILSSYRYEYSPHLIRDINLRIVNSFHVLSFNTLRPRRNEQHFADDIFKRIFFNENVWISIKVSLKFVCKRSMNNIPALVQIMAWRRSGDKPLSGSMMISLPTHICVSRPQWVNPFMHVFTLFDMGEIKKETLKDRAYVAACT